MNSHKAAIANIRQKIKTLSEEKPALRAKCRELKNRFITSNAETGPERCKLRLDYVTGTQDTLRHLYIAYALLRGRPYLSVEAKCAEAPFPKTVSWHIYRAFGIHENAESWTDEELKILDIWEPLKVEDLMYPKNPVSQVPAQPIVTEQNPRSWFHFFGRIFGQ